MAYTRKIEDGRWRTVWSTRTDRQTKHVNVKVDEAMREQMISGLSAAQYSVDRDVLNFTEPYMPYRTGQLVSEWQKQNKMTLGRGYLELRAPSVRYLYYGQVYGPNFMVNVGDHMEWRSFKGREKKPTGRELHFNPSVHPLATPHWFDYMIMNHYDEIKARAQKAMDAAVGKRG